MCSTSWPGLLDADWCLRSDVVTNSRLQAQYRGITTHLDCVNSDWNAAFANFDMILNFDMIFGTALHAFLTH